MASQYGSSSAPRKKMVTYGMPSRKRRNDNVAFVSESSAPAPRQKKPLGNISMSSNIENAKAQHGQSKLMSPNQEPYTSRQQNDDARKRRHSAAFATDTAATMPVSQATEMGPNKSSRTPREPHDHRANHPRAHPVVKASSTTTELNPPSPIMPIRAGLGSPDGKHVERVSLSRLEMAGSGESQGSQPPLRRARLIDALVAQRADSPEMETCPSGGSSSPSVNTNQDDLSQPQSSIGQRDSQSRRFDTRGMTAKGRKIKFTYSQSRGLQSSSNKPETPSANGYADENDIFELSPARMSPPPRSPSPVEEAEEKENSKHAIQSVHELRRAGAKNRFSDEMDDLLSRIGSPGPSPSTMRRNGLCELVRMLQKEEFASQFRDHASRDNIAKDIRGEKDTISGFVLAAVLVIFLSSNLAPHLLRQLAEDRIGLWLGQLLTIQEDIATIAAQRSMNVPKATRTSLAGVKKILVGMSIWHGHTILSLSPRTVALQLLNILFRSSDAQYLHQIVLDSSKDIAKLADYYAHEGSVDDIDFAIIISILEAQSSLATVAGHPVSDTQRQASRVAKFLQVTLQRWPHGRRELDAALLKLATNTTNNEAGAMAFDNVGLLSNLADCIGSGFGFVKNAIGNARFESFLYDELLLILGILINILEHCPDARASANGRPLKNLVALWLDNQILMNEADSVEKSKLSVALGYLAVLLGYAFLSRPGWTETPDHVKLPSIRDLVDSIQEFIVMYKSVDNRVHELEGLVGELLRQDQQERRQAQRRRLA
ncbi:hypothetical protein PT974_04232 [Cladobotryum mycophilum]|uniref:Wings apart-like protein C-terminal domain-containing protein n=1 Tax=Cladobotryum mycophilum TaxID=491253 RepID=A0ABR0SUJ7_9HYPO